MMEFYEAQHILPSFCFHSASLPLLLSSTFFSSSFTPRSIRNFLCYCCENTYSSNNRSTRKGYFCAEQTQNDAQPPQKISVWNQAQGESVWANDSMKYLSIFVSSMLLVLLGFIHLLNRDVVQIVGVGK